MVARHTPFFRVLFAGGWLLLVGGVVELVELLG